MIFFFHDYQLKIILFVRLNEHREIYQNLQLTLVRLIINLIWRHLDLDIKR
jgi:hypothetical protein